MLRPYKLTSDGWRWDTDYIKNFPNDIIKNIYLYDNNDIWLLYLKPCTKKYLTFLIDKSRNELLCYLDYTRYIPTNYYKIVEEGLCTFCQIYKPYIKQFNIGREDFRICNESSLETTPNNELYTNTKYLDYQHQIEYIIGYNYGTTFLYRMKIPEKFTIIKEVNKRWFEYIQSTPCDCCGLNNKYFNSICKDCYNAIYNLFYNQHLCKYGLIKEFIFKDLVPYIMDLYLLLLGFNNISVNNLSKKENTIFNKDLIEEDLIEEDLIEEDLIEEDLIDENNVYYYVNEKDYEGLGTWSDEQ